MERVSPRYAFSVPRIPFFPVVLIDMPSFFFFKYNDDCMLRMLKLFLDINDRIERKR